MARTLNEVRDIAMELTESDRELLAEALVASLQWNASVKEEWILEARERLRRLETGEDPGMTLEEFFAD
jgi:DNA-binding MarR family transcriptional regulator